ncbi:hypothetical protein [Nocardia wallacei]|uniref:hypothetical protein n=1 Tax=Nocardia wallacei TaxID=480035 RepID=UPI0024587B92|nr:hypothetical protein [Nocardia wallacei]
MIVPDRAASVVESNEHRGRRTVISCERVQELSQCRGSRLWLVRCGNAFTHKGSVRARVVVGPRDRSLHLHTDPPEQQRLARTLGVGIGLPNEFGAVRERHRFDRHFGRALDHSGLDNLVPEGCFDTTAPPLPRGLMRVPNTRSRVACVGLVSDPPIRRPGGAVIRQCDVEVGGYLRRLEGGDEMMDRPLRAADLGIAGLSETGGERFGEIEVKAVLVFEDVFGQAGDPFLVPLQNQALGLEFAPRLFQHFLQPSGEPVVVYVIDRVRELVGDEVAERGVMALFEVGPPASLSGSHPGYEVGGVVEGQFDPSGAPARPRHRPAEGRPFLEEIDAHPADTGYRLFTTTRCPRVSREQLVERRQKLVDSFGRQVRVIETGKGEIRMAQSEFREQAGLLTGGHLGSIVRRVPFCGRQAGQEAVVGLGRSVGGEPFLPLSQTVPESCDPRAGHGVIEFRRAGPGPGRHGVEQFEQLLGLGIRLRRPGGGFAEQRIARIGESAAHSRRQAGVVRDLREQPRQFRAPGVGIRLPDTLGAVGIGHRLHGHFRRTFDQPASDHSGLGRLVTTISEYHLDSAGQFDFEFRGDLRRHAGGDEMVDGPLRAAHHRAVDFRVAEAYRQRLGRIQIARA